jgi:predicted enzyme related to lactoylglutathione lyase
MTADRQASLDFYTRLFGWTTSEWDMGATKYTMLRAGSRDIGGVVQVRFDPPVASHRLAYVLVDDVDRAAECAEAAGGSISFAPTDIPSIGRFAVLRDPQGARIAAFESASEDQLQPDGSPQPGTFTWNELLTTDPEAAGRCYASLFGWDMRSLDMGAAGTYYIFSSGGKDVAGMLQMPAGAEATPFWLGYVTVDDVDQSTARLQELGGVVHVQPSDIPNVGRFAVTADPHGATVAMFKPVMVAAA